MLVVLAFCAGTFLFCSALGARLPRGVYIDGLNVGGMTRAAAEAAARAKRVEEMEGKRLVVLCGDERREYSWPCLAFTDDLFELTRSIRRKGSYFSRAELYLNGLESVADGICAALGRPLVEPYAEFSAEGKPFTYFEGSDGAEVCREELISDIRRSLAGGLQPVRARVEVTARTLSLKDISARTALLASFSTRFDSSNAARSFNISLAARAVNGYVVQPGRTFSFNAAVGPRTAERGYKSAKIISEGRFAEGVGGGVCQVSTTLYNAAVLAGLKIVEYHPHSLAVSYVAPSRDAMVSGTYCDLKFANTSSFPVYIRADCSGGVLSCSVYGLSDGVKRTFLSRTVGTIPKPEDIIVEGEAGLISPGREGTISEGYLVEEREGAVTQKLVRRDSYSAVAAVRGAGQDAQSGGR